ncbi:hypothetical protein BG004_007747 [Podila humilis]|nr:hypothetical protein BG004_007747 [Podila humilis]
MTDEAVSQYFVTASLRANFGVIDFFISRNPTSEERDSLSAAWLRGMNCLQDLNLKRMLIAEWEATVKARNEFWDRLDEQQRDEMYCKNLEESVVGDKLYVAVQHAKRIRKDAAADEQDQVAELQGKKRGRSDILLGSPEEQD